MLVPRRLLRWHDEDRRHTAEAAVVLLASTILWLVGNPVTHSVEISSDDVNGGPRDRKTPKARPVTPMRRFILIGSPGREGER
jgi:hypothetical protein